MAIILHTEPTTFKLLPSLLPEIDVHKSPPIDTGVQVVLRWGVTEGTDTATLVLNRAQAIRNMARMNEFFEINRIPYSSSGTLYYRKYRFYMFDMTLVRILRKEIGQRNVHDVSWSESKEARDGSILAARTLHVLGLDFGLVELGVDTRGRQYIVGVEAGPRLTKRLAQAYAEPIRKRLREAELRQTMPIFQKANPAYLEKIVSIGADPEFMLRDGRTGRLIMASRFFPRDGLVGCDARFVKGAVSGYPLAELRPEPSYSPLQLVENIRITMNKALRLAPYSNVQWRAGSMPFGKFPIGGHVHFVGVPLSGQLIRVLDNYLAVPLLLLEEPSTARRRRKKYGYLGDFRHKEHGGFEYRTPASWLVSPQVTKAVMCLAKVLASEYQLLTQDLFLLPSAQEAFIAANREYFVPHFASIWSELSKTSTFKLYAADLEIIETMVKGQLTWNERADIRRTWELSIPRGRVYRP
ncbi:MAG: hypothetical protein FD169_111 [Bacillota bacterium]|nr:MAG: hypothetical protein FD169_111 [Bacillota bacterium]MBS3949070.1 hypothetical protein [Peptococcaceae bacterium]